MSISETPPHLLLTGSFQAAVAAVQADRVLPGHLPPPPEAGRALVLGAGKAAAAMAATVEALWPENASLSGMVITRHGHGRPTQRIRVVEAGHPLPDAAGLGAARTLLGLARSARPEDQAIALISGGGSSLLGLPAPGLTLADLRATGAGLLASGAPIAEINCVRKHLSLTLGGRLAESCTAPVRVLMISDVTGDDPSVIASGPFAADPTTYADALSVLQQWRVAAPAAVLDHLHKGTAGHLAETPKPGDACLARVEHRLLANGRTALLGAAGFFRERGVQPVILGDTLTGEAREVAQVLAALVREVRLHASPWRPPVALLSGGETSVTVRGKGLGGRNAEFLLALALALDGLAGVHALAADTDGLDGLSDCAGALIAPDTLARAKERGLSAKASLEDNDAHGFFAALGDQVLTGATRTNTNDYRVILIT